MKRLLPLQNRRQRQPSAKRLGTTLSEILISLMVMGIGVTSLALLISTSVLRSIQATQLTNATIHRMNLEQLFELFPRLLFDPNITEAQSGRYVIDPLGATSSTISPAAARSVFGNDSGAVPAGFSIARYHGGFDNLGNLQPPPQNPAPALSRNPNIAYLSDSWQLAAKGTSPVLDTVNHTITVGTGVDTQTAQNTLASLGVGSVRLTLFSANGKSSVTRFVTNVASTVISWDNPASTTDDLPSAGYGTIQRYRLEFVDPRYSWLLTVRKTPNSMYPSGDAHVDVVVFHKRGFAATNEQIYTATFTRGNTFCTIPTGGTLPFLKKGSFVFDAQNAYWYRIVQIKTDPANPQLIITLDSAVKANSTRLMGMPGVVEVYPLGTFSYDPNNPP